MESSSKKIKRKGIFLKFRVRACTCMEISTRVFELIEKRKRNLRRGVHTHTHTHICTSGEKVEEVHRMNFSKRKKRGKKGWRVSKN